MLALEANIPPSPTRFNLFGKPSWALNRTKIKTNTDKPKPRILCKLHINRPLGHLLTDIMLLDNISIDSNLVKYRFKMTSRRLLMRSTGRQDSSRRQL